MSELNIIIDRGVGLFGLSLITAFTSYACSPNYAGELEDIHKRIGSLDGFNCIATQGFSDQIRAMDAASSPYTVVSQEGKCFVVGAPK